MQLIDTPLDGLLLIEPRVFGDPRGYFFESYQNNRYQELGIPPFVQDNMSHSKRDVLRGLHYQLPYAQGKLVGVSRGAVWDVVVDIRLSSPTFGQWFGTTLSALNHRQMYVPPGFAHGFCVLSDDVDFYYKCTDYYQPTAERGIAWNDPNLKINWPVAHPILSPKDEVYLPLHEMPRDQLFT